MHWTLNLFLKGLLCWAILMKSHLHTSEYWRLHWPWSLCLRKSLSEWDEGDSKWNIKMTSGWRWVTGVLEPWHMFFRVILELQPTFERVRELESWRSTEVKDYWSIHWESLVDLVKWSDCMEVNPFFSLENATGEIREVWSKWIFRGCWTRFLSLQLDQEYDSAETKRSRCGLRPRQKGHAGEDGLHLRQIGCVRWQNGRISLQKHHTFSKRFWDRSSRNRGSAYSCFLLIRLIYSILRKTLKTNPSMFMYNWYEHNFNQRNEG